MIAKPIVKNKYWVVTDGTTKIGNMVCNDLGYNLNINGYNKFFNNVKDLKQQTNITFQKIPINRKKANIPFSEYPTTSKIYNSVMDIKKKIHLFTKNKKSKCFYAAGWYVIEQNDVKKVVFCPKYIFIQRYKYSGPYKTKTEAEQVINI